MRHQMMIVSENLKKWDVSWANGLGVQAKVDLSNHRLLVVDDSADSCILIKMVLAKNGAEVICADTAQEGLRLMESFKPHMVLLDIVLPDISGYEFAEMARRDGYKGKIIAVTACAMKHQLDKCLEHGCDGFMSKPVDFGTFIALIYCELKSCPQIH